MFSYLSSVESRYQRIMFLCAEWLAFHRNQMVSEKRIRRMVWILKCWGFAYFRNLSRLMIPPNHCWEWQFSGLIIGVKQHILMVQTLSHAWLFQSCKLFLYVGNHTSYTKLKYWHKQLHQNNDPGEFYFQGLCKQDSDTWY